MSGDMSKQPGAKLANGADRHRGGRPPGSRNKRTIIRQQLAEAFEGGEAGFWRAVAEQAKAGDLQAAAMLADRLYPRLKPTSEPVQLSEPLDGSLAENARAVLRMIAAGEISADMGRELLTSIADVAKILEVADLEKRIERLEALK